jgi:hypothetical protein
MRYGRGTGRLDELGERDGRTIAMNEQRAKNERR